jgi:subtilisin family serine protease
MKTQNIIVACIGLISLVGRSYAELQYAPGQLIVAYNLEEFDSAFVDSVEQIRLAGAFIVETPPPNLDCWSPAFPFDRWISDEGVLIDVLAIAEDLSNIPGIDAFPNYAIPVSSGDPIPGQFLPNDEFWSDQWPLHSNPGMLHMPSAWNKTKGSSDELVAIVDTGVQYGHPDLNEKVWINPGENLDHDSELMDQDDMNHIDDDDNSFVDDLIGWDFYANGEPGGDNTVNPDYDESLDHGTRLAGCCCAETDNEIGIAGVAWNPKFMIVRVGFSNFVYLWESMLGVCYAYKNGARVINMSWGTQYQSEIYVAYRQTLLWLAQHDVVLVAAAGNDLSDEEIYPAAFSWVFSVGGIEETNHLWHQAPPFWTNGSNWGGWVDLAAGAGDDLIVVDYANGYTYTSGHWGTSYATAFVSGVAALVRSQHPDWTRVQVVEKLMNSVDPIDYDDERWINGGALDASEALGPDQ